MSNNDAEPHNTNVHYRLEHIPSLEISKPKKKAFLQNQNPNLPKLHTLCIAAARRGGGKTTAVTNLIRFYKKSDMCDRCFIISPTAVSNKEFYNDLVNDERDIYTEMDNSVIKEVIRQIEQEAKEYKEYLRIKELYDVWKRFESGKIDVTKVDPQDMIDFDVYHIWEYEERPKSKYKNEKPIIHVLIDDCMGSQIMRPNSPLVNLCIRHRHVGDGLGCSIYILTQSYVAHGSVPRPIRENAILLLLWGVRDEKLREQIADEACGIQFTKEQFLMAFDICTQENQHGFLMVDYTNEKKKYLRKGFNEYIIFD